MWAQREKMRGITDNIFTMHDLPNDVEALKRDHPDLWQSVFENKATFPQRCEIPPWQIELLAQESRCRKQRNNSDEKKAQTPNSGENMMGAFKTMMTMMMQQLMAPPARASPNIGLKMLQSPGQTHLSAPAIDRSFFHGLQPGNASQSSSQIDGGDQSSSKSVGGGGQVAPFDSSTDFGRDPGNCIAAVGSSVGLDHRPAEQMPRDLQPNGPGERPEFSVGDVVACLRHDGQQPEQSYSRKRPATTPMPAPMKRPAAAKVIAHSLAAIPAAPPVTAEMKRPAAARIIVDSPVPIPKGWICFKKAGRADKYWSDPSGRQFRTAAEVRAALGH